MDKPKANWFDVEFMLADGSKVPGRASRADDGTTNPQYLHVRFAKPFNEYAPVPRKVLASLDELAGRFKELQAKHERERVNHAVATVLLDIRKRAERIETHFRDGSGTMQPHTAKGAIKDFVAIVDEELAKVQGSE